MDLPIRAHLSPSQIFISSNNISHLANTRHVVHHACRASNDMWSITTDLTATSRHPLRQQNCFDPNVGCMDKLSRAYGIKVEDFRPVINSVQDPLQSLVLIDATQRLGIDFHFQEEIEKILLRHDMKINLISHEYQPLFEVSLCFRLLRQGGHYIPAEVFNNFKDKKGIRFKEELKTDIRGLMELYEAAQLNLEGEDILCEAADFSWKHLNGSLKHLEESQAKKVHNTLRHPYHKSLSKFMAKTFFKDLKGISGWVKSMKELAWMEFMMAQCKHRQELSQISRWWKDLHLLKDLELARDQPLKWYTWTMATLGDTSLSELRIEATKSISFIYIIDDIFDIYGTIDELTLFTEAVNRWDLDSIEVDQLPDYMKTSFKALCNVTSEIGYKIHRKYGHNPVYFLRKTWASLCNAFLAETKWFASGDLPKADDYLKIATVSSGVHTVLVHIFFLLGLGATNESETCLNDIADITSSVATILRLWDDLGSAKDEKQDGYDGSYINCYVQEHNVTTEFARQHVLNMISNEWTKLNKESLRLHKLAPSFMKVPLNLARMIPLMYDYSGDQSLPLLEAHVKSVLHDDLSSEPLLEARVKSVLHNGL